MRQAAGHDGRQAIQAENDDAQQEIKDKLPLSEERIDVTEVAGKPGVYKAVVFLKPHFQLDELTVSLRLVADLPAPAAG